MIEFLPFNQSAVSDSEWDKFVDESDNGTMFHKRLFISYHPKGRFKDASVVIKKDKKILSVFPAVILEREGKRILSSHGGASYGSFVYGSYLNFREAFDLINSSADLFRRATFCKIVCFWLKRSINTFILHNRI